MWLYFVFIAGIACTRLYEVRLSKKYLDSAQIRSEAQPISEPIYPWMVLFHTSWLASCVAEVYFLERPFLLVWGILMGVVLGGAFSARIWVLRTMREAWNVKIIHRPQQKIVSSGPYRYIRHPNYLIVIVEIFCIPMIHSAYLTACIGSVFNGILIWKRLQKEEAYLSSLPAYENTMGHRPRFVPNEVTNLLHKFFKQ